MPQNKLAWRRPVFVILILASLALLTVSFRETESGPVHAIQEAGASLLTPLNSWGAKVAEPFQDGYQWLKTLWSARASRAAGGRAAGAAGEAISSRSREENLPLRGLLDLKNKGTYPTAPSSRSPR